MKAMKPVKTMKKSQTSKALHELHRLHDLHEESTAIRREIVDVLTDLGHEHRGHPGASLSIVEIITALYFEILRVDPARPDWPDRDRFVLSKGHGCLALYVALARRGFFDPRHLRTFRSVDSILQGHPDMRRTPGIDMTSGSLGHGLSAVVGMALDLRQRGSDARVCVLVGDGELQEGLIWEGAMAAAKFGLSRVTMFVDCNGLQSGGRVADIMPIEPVAAKFRAFGWRVLEIDGHDLAAIVAAARAASRSRRPTAVLARTIKGKGVSYMEDDNRWHQRAPPTEAPASSFFSAPGAPPPGARAAGGITTRAAFGSAVLELAREGRDIMVVTSDTCSSMGLDAFAREFPRRHVEVGIAEQNLMAIAAGLAAGGRTVFVATYGTFASLRTLEQVRTFIASPRLRVIIAAGLTGLSGGLEGVAHLAVEDVGVLRCVPDLIILNPSGAGATRALVRAAADHDGPVYLRLGRDETSIASDEPYTTPIGPALIRRESGRDVALLTSGLITADVLAAADALDAIGIRATVIEFPTLKPIDRAAVLWARSHARTLVTIEEHSCVGGLGSIVTEVLDPLDRIALPDRFLESGSPAELREKYGLTADAIVRQVSDLCRGAARPARERRRDDRVEHAQHDRGGGEGDRSPERHQREQYEHDR
jgi:transketolase